MDFTKIIVVSGKSGAFKVIAQTRGGLIVESLIDGKRMPVSAANRITSVEDIVVFTETDEVKLKEVFQKIKEITNGEQAIDHKSDDHLVKEFFEKVMPDYDKERVYFSDMKKMIFWYNLLQKNDMLDFEEEEKIEEVEEKKTKKDVVKEDTQVIEKKKVAATPKKTAAKPQADKKISAEKAAPKKASPKK